MHLPRSLGAWLLALGGVALAGCGDPSRAAEAPTAPGAGTPRPGSTATGRRAAVLRAVNAVLDDVVDVRTARAAAPALYAIAASGVPPLAGTAGAWEAELRYRADDPRFAAELESYRAERARFEAHRARVYADPELQAGLAKLLARFDALFAP